MTTPWDSNGTLPSTTAEARSVAGTEAWQTVPAAMSPSPVPPVSNFSEDEWVYVDPSSYSNPNTAAPVYTSGLQPPPPVLSDPPPIVGLDGPPPPSNGAYPIPVTESLFEPVSSDPGTAEGLDPQLSRSYQPEKGELRIKERRSWKTWQLLAATVVAVVVGMAINGNTGSGAGSSTSSGSTSGTLPPAAGSSSAPASASTGGTTATTAAGATATTLAGSTTTTSVAGATAAAGSPSPTSAVAVGPPTVLIPATQQSGNWTSPAFTIAGGTWNIGWAFQCTPAPSATPSFQIFVVNNGASPAGTPAATSSVAAGNAVTPLTSTGSQQVVVQTTAACRWAVKVTGSSS